MSKTLDQSISEIESLPQADAAYAAAAAEADATITPYSPEALRDFALGRITLGDLEGLGKEPQYEMAQLGFGYLEQGKLDLARQVFAGLLALDPFDAYFHTALGSVSHREGDLEQAEHAYSRAIEINPFSPVAWAHRGEVRLMLGRLDEAAGDLVKAIETDPECADPATQRASALAQTLREQLGEVGLSDEVDAAADNE